MQVAARWDDLGLLEHARDNVEKGSPAFLYLAQLVETMREELETRKEGELAAMATSVEDLGTARQGDPQRLTGIDAERDDDGEITVRWDRGTDVVSLVCRPDGTLFRIVSPGRASEPALKTHVSALSAARGMPDCNEIPLSRTARGFVRGDFIDAYGNECSVQESSLASGAHIWLGLNKDRMHLTREMAASLVPLLRHFAAFGDLRPQGKPLAEADA